MGGGQTISRKPRKYSHPKREPRACGRAGAMREISKREKTSVFKVQRNYPETKAEVRMMIELEKPKIRGSTRQKNWTSKRKRGRTRSTLTFSRGKKGRTGDEKGERSVVTSIMALPRKLKRLAEP